MQLLRLIAVLHALSLMIGEAWRSWGADRPFVFVVDDFILGLFLLFGAYLMANDSFRHRAVFAAGWGFSAGLLYSSFFSKIAAPQTTNAGNWDLSVLTVLVGIAFATAIGGLITTLLLPQQEQP